ncbi:hypothetical protein BKA62DRAFT_658212 [Auriculariales sp. MPI-PUGE-AT-0066]|nr:hypothetical protein BKA62DRAFT_658212 [Auriculariales sp. MPI-PUGE-AT-0066]
MRFYASRLPAEHLLYVLHHTITQAEARAAAVTAVPLKQVLRLSFSDDHSRRMLQREQEGSDFPPDCLDPWSRLRRIPCLLFEHRDTHTRVIWPPGRGPGLSRHFSSAQARASDADPAAEISSPTVARGRPRKRPRGPKLFNGVRDQYEWLLPAKTLSVGQQTALLVSARQAVAPGAQFYTFWTTLKRLPLERVDFHLREEDWKAVLARIGDAVERLLAREELPLRRLHVWGLRANFALARISPTSYISPGKDDNPHERVELRCLALWGTLFAGTVPDGLNAARYFFTNSVASNTEPLADLVTLRVILTVLRVCHAQQHTVAGIEFLLDVWLPMQRWIVRTPPPKLTEEHASLATDIRKAMDRLVSRFMQTGSPMPWLKRVRERSSKERFSAASALLVQALADLHVSERALEVFRHAESCGVSFTLSSRLNLIRSLTVDDNFAAARQLQSSIPQDQLSEHTLKSELYTSGHQGDLRKADSTMEHLVNPGWNDKVAHIRAAAVSGDVKRALDLFSKYRPSKPGFRGRASYPFATVKMWEPVIFALLEVGRLSDAEAQLAQLRKEGYQPSLQMYDSIIRVHARNGDAERASNTYREMLADGIEPGGITYLQLMVLCARRKDPDGAREILSQAQKAGIPVTNRMYTTLMDACVEAGAWRKVIELFRQLERERDPDLRPTIEVYNTVLKAYVRMGMPFKLVFNFFQKLARIGHIKPTQVTYALLVQSAAETRHFIQAQQLLRHMHSLAKIPTQKDFRIIPMSVMLASMLPGRAQTVYAEMQNKGIDLEAWTYGTILQTSARRNQRTPERTHQLLQSILTRSSVRNLEGHKKAIALRMLYAPVIKMHTLQGDMSVAHRLHQDMLHRGGSPSIVTLWLMMDGFLAAGDYEQVRTVWRQVFDLALKERDISAFVPVKRHKQTNSNLLCAPLSTYLHALSAMGRHDEIAEVWREVRRHGFGYDANNWTVLCTTLIQARRLDRAYEIVERVLIPAHEQAMTALKHQAWRKDSEGASSVDEDDGVELTFASKDARKRLAAARHIQKLLSKDAQRNLMQRVWRTPDAVMPLQTLLEISPLWNNWYPHPSLLRLLFVASRELFKSKTAYQAAQRVEDLLQMQRIRASLKSDYPRATELVLTKGRDNFQKARAKMRRAKRPSWREYRSWLVKRWLARKRGVKVSLPENKQMMSLIRLELNMSKRRRRVPWVHYLDWLDRWQQAWRELRQIRYQQWVRRGRPIQDGSPRRLYAGDKPMLSAKRTGEQLGRRRRAERRRSFGERRVAAWKFKRDPQMRKKEQPSTMFWA